MAHSAESLQQAFKYLFPSEVAALKDLARSLPPNPVVVNIGAGAGTSGLAFMESRDDLHLYTIDTQYEDSPFGSLSAEIKVLDEAGLYGGHCVHICSDSKNVGRRWQEPFDTYVVELYTGRIDRRVDLVFVDGDHSYRGAKGDILAWLPNIKPGGIMAVHDYGKREVFKNGPIEGAPHPLPWPGVDRAVRKFLCGKYEIIMHVDTLIAFRIV